MSSDSASAARREVPVVGGGRAGQWHAVRQQADVTPEGVTRIQGAAAGVHPA